MENVTIELTPQKYNTIMMALLERPAKEVIEVIQELQRQVSVQHTMQNSR